MNERTYFFISGFICALVAIVHLLRIINQFQVVIGIWSVPMAISWVGLIIAGSLSYWDFALISKENRR
jgi:hypothetical protein